MKQEQEEGQQEQGRQQTMVITADQDKDEDEDDGFTFEFDPNFEFDAPKFADFTCPEFQEGNNIQSNPEIEENDENNILQYLPNNMDQLEEEEEDEELDEEENEKIDNESHETKQMYNNNKNNGSKQRMMEDEFHEWFLELHPEHEPVVPFDTPEPLLKADVKLSMNSLLPTHLFSAPESFKSPKPTKSFSGGKPSLRQQQQQQQQLNQNVHHQLQQQNLHQQNQMMFMDEMKSPENKNITPSRKFLEIMDSIDDAEKDAASRGKENKTVSIKEVHLLSSPLFAAMEKKRKSGSDSKGKKSSPFGISSYRSNGTTTTLTAISTSTATSAKSITNVASKSNLRGLISSTNPISGGVTNSSATTTNAGTLKQPSVKKKKKLFSYSLSDTPIQRKKPIEKHANTGLGLSILRKEVTAHLQPLPVEEVQKATPKRRVAQSNFCPAPLNTTSANVVNNSRPVSRAKQKVVEEFRRKREEISMERDLKALLEEHNSRIARERRQKH